MNQEPTPILTEELQPSPTLPLYMEGGFSKNITTKLDLFTPALQSKKETRREKHQRNEREILETAKTEGRRLSPHERFGKKHLNHAVDRNADEDVRTVFVGNLPNMIAKKDVMRFFANSGEVVNTRIRCQVLAKPDDGKQRGRAIRVLRKEFKDDEQYSAVAYVLFASKEAVEKALVKTGMVFKDRHITVTQESVLSKAYDPKTSLFLGNIAYDTSDEQIWRFFLDNGANETEIKRVRVIRDRETGAAKGFGYVEFASAPLANQMIQLRGTELNGRELRICHCNKSKNPAIAKLQASRRENRKHGIKKQTTKDGHQMKNTKPNNGNSDNQYAGGKVNKSALEARPWMGAMVNPRRKLSKELRVLVPSHLLAIKEKKKGVKKGIGKPKLNKAEQ